MKTKRLFGPGGRLDASVLMFKGRYDSARARGDSGKRVITEFLRFLGNVSERHGPEFAAYCIKVWSDDGGPRMAVLMRTATSLLGEPGYEKALTLFHFLKKTLQPS